MLVYRLSKSHRTKRHCTALITFFEPFYRVIRIYTVQGTGKYSVSLRTLSLRVDTHVDP